jgi:hypothetical protein
MASGSQHSTMARISHRIAVSGSVTPKTAATYWIGAAADATVLPRAATLARSVCSAATQSTRLAAALIHEFGTSPALALDRGQRSYGPAAPGRLLDREVDLADPPVEVGYPLPGDLGARRKRRVLHFHGRRRLSPLADMGRYELGVDASRIDDGKAGDERHQGQPPDPRRHPPAMGKPGP